MYEQILAAEIPEELDFLGEPHRYKVAYGGRDGGKSWSFARALLMQGRFETLNILCAREFQNSIKDSVHRLLGNQVKDLGLEDFYDVQSSVIRGVNGTEIAFKGLRHNTVEIKSMEGVDRCWVEEANNVSKASWEVLIPTIRKKDSEIWVSFNPELETDETYRRFVLKPPGGAVVKKVTWRENPWRSPVLEQERDLLRARDEDAYLNIWEGHCRVTLDGAIYATEIRAATAEDRLTRVPYDEAEPVQTFWDLGWSDCTSIWFAQKIGFEYHLIDYYQSRLQKLAHYLQILQSKGYVYGKHYLPHDADNESLASESIAKTMGKVWGKQNVVTVPRVQDKTNGLKATRELFPRCWFDAEKCADGLQALRHYRYDVDEHGQFSKHPLHDENSHGADAFETFARSVDRRVHSQQVEVQVVGNYDRDTAAVSWMGT